MKQLLLKVLVVLLFGVLLTIQMLRQDRAMPEKVRRLAGQKWRIVQMRFIENRTVTAPGFHRIPQAGPFVDEVFVTILLQPVTGGPIRQITVFREAPKYQLFHSLKPGEIIRFRPLKKPIDSESYAVTEEFRYLELVISQ